MDLYSGLLLSAMIFVTVGASRLALSARRSAPDSTSAFTSAFGGVLAISALAYHAKAGHGAGTHEAMMLPALLKAHPAPVIFAFLGAAAGLLAARKRPTTPPPPR